MASITICDVCGKEIKPSGMATPITLAVKRSDTLKRVIDLHEKCYGALLHWLAESKDNAAKYKDVG